MKGYPMAFVQIIACQVDKTAYIKQIIDEILFQYLQKLHFVISPI